MAAPVDPESVWDRLFAIKQPKDCNMDKSNFYELTYIVKTVLDESDIKATVEKVTNFLTENGAKIDEVDEWGNRELSYEIENMRSGYYVNMYFVVAGEVMVQLERMLNLDDNIVRFLFLKYDSKMLRHRELAKKGEIPNIFAVEEEEENS